MDGSASPLVIWVATLPAPSQAVTDALRGAVDNFHLAGSKCGTLTPEAGRDAVQAVLTDLQNGMAAMQEASNAINSAAE